MSFLAYGSVPMRIIGGLVALYGAWLMTMSVREVIRAKAVKPLILSNLIAALYPIGLGLKVAIVGPAFFRWHLSDIGFPVYVGYYMLFMPWWSGFKRSSEYEGMNGLERDEKYLGVRQKMLVIAFGLSIFYELTVGFLYSLRPDITPTFVGTLDWLDMLCYTIGTAVALFDYRRTGKVLEGRRRAFELAMREREIIDLNAQRERRKQQPPRNQSRRSRRRSSGR